MHFDWSLTQSFLAVLDAGSLSAAARQLGWQQPTLGRHIAALEAQLGAELFERSRQGLRPTALAKQVEPAARAMAQGAADFSLRATKRGAPDRGTVRISVSEVMASWLMPRVLADLCARYPSIAIELVASNLQDNLLMREADLALRMVKPQTTGLVAKKLADVPIIAAASEGYWAQCASDDWRAHRWVGFDRKDRIIVGMRSVGMDLAPSDFAVRTDDERAYVRLVEAGLGVGFVASYIAAQLPGLRRVFPQWAIPAMPMWLVTHREARDVPVIRTVFDVLAQQVPLALQGPFIPSRPRR